MLSATIVASKVLLPALSALSSHARERRAGPLHKNNQTKTIKREQFRSNSRPSPHSLSQVVPIRHTNQPMLFMCRPTCSAPLVRPVLLWLFLSLFVLMPSFASCPPWSHALIILGRRLAAPTSSPVSFLSPLSVGGVSRRPNLSLSVPPSSM